MINKTLSKNSIIPVSSPSSPVRVYVSKMYKEYMDKYNNIKVPGNTTRYKYPQRLYECMDNHFIKNAPIYVYEVTDSPLDGRFVYVDISGLRVSDLPIQCFTMVALEGYTNDLLRNFK